MKKLLLSIVFIVTLVTLSACSSPYPQRTPASYVGVVSQNGSTFLFTADDGAFQIRSTFLNLIPYLNKKVKIHGQFSQSIFFVDDVKPAAN